METQESIQAAYDELAGDVQRIETQLGIHRGRVARGAPSRDPDWRERALLSLQKKQAEKRELKRKLLFRFLLPQIQEAVAPGTDPGVAVERVRELLRSSPISGG